jgi:hypothetical protein
MTNTGFNRFRCQLLRIADFFGIAVGDHSETGNASRFRSWPSKPRYPVRQIPICQMKARSSDKQAIGGFMRDEIAAGTFRQMPINEASEIVFGMVDSAMRHAASGNIHEARLIYVPLLAGMMTRAVAANPLG